jgi:hypothetical protein
MSAVRKNQGIGLRFGAVIKALCLCLFLGGAGVGYVRQKNQIYALADEMKKCDGQVRALREQNRKRSRLLESLQSPLELEIRLKRMNFGLIAPQPDHVVRLFETSTQLNPSPTQRLFATQSQP